MFANFSLDILSLIQSFKDQWILSVSEVPVPAPNTKIPTLFKGDLEKNADLKIWWWWDSNLPPPC